MFLEDVEEDGSEAEVTFHKLLWVLWTVYTCEVEDEVTFLTPPIELL